MARGQGCRDDKTNARPRGDKGDATETLARGLHSSLCIRFGTSTPFAIGKIGFQRIGYASTPMLSVPVDVPERSIDELVPIARQAAFAYLAERGIDDNALGFSCTVAMKRKRRFTDDNESSESYGKNKMGRLCEYHFECTPLLTAAVQWGPSGGSSYGTLKANWELDD